MCSGRTATTLGPRGTSGSATGTRVSRPGGAATSLRVRSQTARARPQPGPGHRRSSRRRRASRGPTVRPDSGARSTGLLRRRAEGQDGRPGSHRGPVDESGPGTEVDGLSGIRIRVMPLGAEPGCGTRKRLRGVDRFAGRLLGAVSAFSAVASWNTVTSYASCSPRSGPELMARKTQSKRPSPGPPSPHQRPLEPAVRNADSRPRWRRPALLGLR